MTRQPALSRWASWPSRARVLAALRESGDRSPLAALGILLLGVALRAATAFPLHKYPADADALLSGLCARRVLRGETPVFFSPPRIGSLECHLAAPLLAALGNSRLPLALVTLALAAATLVTAYLLARELFGTSVALVAMLLLAVPPPAVLFWTYMLNGYPMTLLLCTLVLWLAARLANNGLRPTGGLLFGMAVGLGFWQSFLTLGCSLPAALWLLWRRPRELLARPAFAAAAVGGALLGAAPWFAFNLRYDFSSLTASFVVRPVAGGLAALSNLNYLATYSLPELVVSTDLEDGHGPQSALVQALQPLVLAIYAAAVVFLVSRLLPRRERGSPGSVAAASALLLAVLVAVIGLNVGSGAGEQRGLTVRYVLPLALVAALALAACTVAVSRRSRTVAALMVACVLAHNLAVDWVQLLPTAARRKKLATFARDDAKLVALLERRQVGVVMGSYWMVYPLTYLSGERTIGVPCEVLADHNHHRDRIHRQGVPPRWALAAASWAQPNLEDWAQRAGLAGRAEPVGERYVVLLPTNLPAQPDEALLDRVLAVCAERPVAGP